MIVALLLSVVIGVSLGLLGGGGSILTVPILVYALGVEPKSAIATSLLVVGVTSAAALFAHARAGRVQWRTGSIFGVAAMAGAYAGGRIADFVPGGVLLAGFGVMMLVTAVAMLRQPRPGAAPPRPARASAIVVEGAAVGLVTGMVGAGGGFLVVPALVLLGGLPMGTAVGTSLFVIAMKSFAGFAGYLGHVAVNWELAGLVAAAAVAGSLVGGRLAGRLPQAALRQVFAWFVLVMAAYLIGRQLPQGVRDGAAFRAVFVDRWPWWAGGAALGGFVLLFLWLDNKLLGVSTGCAELCALGRDGAGRRSWRPPFLGGIVLGGLVAALLGGATPTFALGGFDALVGGGAAGKLAVLFAAGGLVGWGARLAGGCTSGHSIVGVAQGSRASLLATLAFLAGGFATTQALARLLG